jgi:hypothetical protein
MLILYSLLLLICGIVILFSFPFLTWLETWRVFSGKRVLQCPETGTDADVELDAKLAARTALIGTLRNRVSKCSHWPKRDTCGQQCIPQAISQNRPDSFEINHFAIFLAALASWAASGALRNSPVALGWMASAGYPMKEFWVTAANPVPKAFPDSSTGLHVPLLVGLLAMLFVAYVLAWIMRHTGASGIADAMLRAGLLWLAIAGATLQGGLVLAPLSVFSTNAVILLIALLIQALVIGYTVTRWDVSSSRPKASRRAVRVA